MPEDNEEAKELVVGCGLLSIIGSFLIFFYAWLIYGMVIFFPAAATHSCRLLVIVSVNMVRENITSARRWGRSSWRWS